MTKRHRNPINSEEPSPDTMSRLWDALDASLDPDDSASSAPPRIGTHSCLRCGNRWNPRAVDPRCCPRCRSAYWDRPPMTARAARPEDTDWSKESTRRRLLTIERRHYRHLAKVKELAKELGFNILDPRTGKFVTKRRMAVVMPVVAADATAPEAEDSGLPSAPPSSMLPLSAFRRTVPPPPGIEDGK
jgi:hypothetical protein